ncbi:MAG: RagB/SusD family nutrient uptake outer membrane protein [Bacteroidales bacterium]|jgi:hypothetical protein|nr:RagB/SusD family nutrient uptake outer membrane protein [Bacteroidales bacterium]
MKNIFILFVVLSFVPLASCSKFLDQKAYGVLTEDDLTTVEQIENSVISAYAGIGNDEINRPLSLWGYGNVRADDAYKGGADENDNDLLHWLEICSPSVGNVGMWYNDVFWYRNYIVISRINSALRALDNVSEGQMPLKTTRIAEMRFLRGHIHFIQKIIFKHIPFITEDMSPDDISNESNVALSSDSVWLKIAEDFEFAYNNLPVVQPEIGRANKYAAAAYLAKTYLYKAYRQDDMHNVTSIDMGELQKVIDLADEVIASPYRLENDFAFNFLPGQYENGPEALFSVQYSMDDGTTYGRLNMGCALTTPTPGGDFNKPSQDLVNAFKTVGGLPDFDNYSTADLSETDKVDPRLFHTVAIPGKPYKYTDVNFEANQTRNHTMYGLYSSLKENVDPASPFYVKTGPWYANSKNWIVLRYADVLLMKAEALIETGRHNEALPLINQIRSRAQFSTQFIAFAAGNLAITTYQDGTNCNWTEDFARKALRWERRLEMAMEGCRFFDLVRWGIADQVMNMYYANEKDAHTYYRNAYFEKNKFEYCAIPVEQINWSKGLYKQNFGY